MNDLSTPEFQAGCKKLQRTTIVTNAIMVLITLAAAVVAIWTSTLGPRDSIDWAEITFFILLGLIMAYLSFAIVWEVLLRIKNWRHICAYIAQGFRTVPQITADGNANFELLLVGDKLTLMREGCGEYVQFDLSPVKSFTSVCANIVRLTKKYITDFYCAVNPDESRVNDAQATTVTLCDKVHGKEKLVKIIIDGKPCKTVTADSLKKWI